MILPSVTLFLGLLLVAVLYKKLLFIFVVFNYQRAKAVINE